MDRILGCLEGIATGDAIGKQTEGLAHADVRRWYPHGIRGFEGAPGSVIPRYAGNSKREWRFGETTDDTERTLAVARAILRDRTVSRVSIGRALLECTKCVHPGIRSLWEFHQAGDPARTTDRHDGCGAAVRVAPVGILYSDSLEELINGAREASISTHGGPLAIAAAAATAAAVSAAVDGASAARILDLAGEAAALAQARWPGDGAPSFAEAIRAVHEAVSSRERSATGLAARCFPDHPLTIVPLALALATTMESAEEAILLAANIGGDSDSVASIAGGVMGARDPGSVNAEWSRSVEAVNHHDLAGVAEDLAQYRCPNVGQKERRG